MTELTKFIDDHQKKQKNDFNMGKIVNNVFSRKK